MAESKQRTFVKGSLIITISNLLIKGVTFFLLPLYTRYLTPKMLGVSDSVTTFTGFVFPILVLGLDSAFSAFYFDVDSREHRLKIFNSIRYLFLGMALVSFVLAFFSKEISRGIFGREDYSFLIWIAVCSMICNLLYLPYSLYVRMENRMMLFAVVSGASSILHLVFNILCLCVLHMGVYSLVVSTFLTQLLQVVLYCVFVRIERAKRFFDRALLGKMLKYSLPLLPVVVVSWVLQASDRYILLRACGEAEVGVYGIGARFGNLVALLANGVYTAYTSYAFGKKDEKDAKQQYARILNDFVYAGLFFCTVLTVFSSGIIRLMTEESYRGAVPLMAPLVFSQLYNGVNTLVGYGIGFAKKTYYFLIATSAGAAVNLVANLIFIPRYGALAASYTTLGSIFVMTLITYIVAQRLYRISYQVKKVFFLPMLVYVVEAFIAKGNGVVQIIGFVAIIILITICYQDSFWDYFHTGKGMLINMRKRLEGEKDAV